MSDLFTSAEIYASDDPDRIVCVEAEHVDAGWQVLTQPVAGGGLRWMDVMASSLTGDVPKYVELLLDDPSGPRSSRLPRAWKITARPAP